MVEKADGTKPSTNNNFEETFDFDSEDIPDKWVFQSYFAFIIWGHFIAIGGRSALYLSNGLDKSKDKSSKKQLQKGAKAAKDNEFDHDSSAVRSTLKP